MTVRVVQVDERCWKCGTACRPIVGVQLAGEWAAYSDGWVDFLGCAEGILATHHPDLLEMHDSGPIEWRRTKYVPEGDWANTCLACRATLGTSPLLEALNDLLSHGTESDELPGWISELPGDVFQCDEDYLAEAGLENGWGEDDPATAAVGSPRVRGGVTWRRWRPPPRSRRPTGAAGALGSAHACAAASADPGQGVLASSR